LSFSIVIVQSPQGGAVGLLVFLRGAVQVFENGLDTLRARDLDELLDTPMVRQKSFADLLPGPVRHVHWLPSASGYLGLNRTMRKVIWPYRHARDLLQTVFLD
jgi:hypothetical protein